MSRKEIEPLLKLIFPEKGIVKIILSFDNSPLDIRRKLINPLLPYFKENEITCPMCNECDNLPERSSVKAVCLKNTETNLVLISKCLPREHISFFMRETSRVRYLDFDQFGIMISENWQTIARIAEEQVMIQFSTYFQNLQTFICIQFGLDVKLL